MESNIHKLKYTAKRYLKVSLCFFVLLFISMVSAFDIHAEEAEEKTVRVGWYQSPRFQEGLSDDVPKSGYSYDFLWNVSDYTSWRYEYVYGEWPELFEMLQNGEIDIMGGVSDTPERRRCLLYPEQPMGTDKYYLYKHSYDDSISASDVSTFNGKKIGLVIDNRMSEYALQWMEDNDLNLKLFYYDNFDDLDKAFDTEMVDIVAKTVDNALNLTNASAVINLGEEPYYMAVSAKRPDLLEEMNAAVNDMLSIDPYIIQNLQYKNFGSSLSGRTLTYDELHWIRKHAVLTVGYFDDYLPYCDTDENGNATGLMTDVLDNAFKTLIPEDVPQLRYIAYTNHEDMVKALKSGDIDIAFPVSIDYWRLEAEDINATSEVISDSGVLFHRSLSNISDVRTLAVDKRNILQLDYSSRVFSDAEIVYYPDIDACLEAVVKGEADATIMDALRVQYATENSDYESLSYVQLSQMTSKAFGVNAANRELLLLLNRAIKLTGSSYGYDCSLKYMNSFYSYTFEDVIRDHAIMLILVGGAVVAMIIMFLAIHMKAQAKALKEKEELRRKADEASAAKSTFLFNMSHDIRTPMNAVMGFAALMEGHLDEPEKLKEYLGKIKFAGEYLLQLINNVLEVARIDSGKETVDYEFADLMNKESYVVFENDLKNKKQTFTQNFDIEHRYVFSDIKKIREIFMNLMSNAIKYTPEGGHIHVDVKELPSERQGYATYIMSVKDDGIGMTKEFQEQIFDTFSRERNTTQSKVMGTGLGMAIVKKLVDIMGGTITVESEPGEGSKFTVTMDHRIVENPQEYLDKRKHAEEEEKLNLSGLRILIAEDNDLNAEIAVTMFEGAGASAEWAKDGVECVDMVRSNPAGYYDLVLMDIQMPHLDGYAATKKIRGLEDSEKASVPIIAMTANAFAEDERAALEAGMNGHLAKPIDVHKMGATIKNVLKR